MRRRRSSHWIIRSAAALVLTLATALVLVTARERLAREQCRANLLHLTFGVRMYAEGRGHFPPATVPNEGLPPTKRLSWIVEILGYLEGGGPWLIDRTMAWDEGVNRAVKRRAKFSDNFEFVEGHDEFTLFHCPSHEAVFDAGGRELTSYVGIAGLGPDAAGLPVENPRAGVFGYDRLTPRDAMTDGTATTMSIAETAESNGPWKAGGPDSVRGLNPSRQPYIGRGRQFGGIHRDGAMVAFADGSVRFIRTTISPKVFEALSTIAGGERLPAGWDQ